LKKARSRVQTGDHAPTEKDLASLLELSGRNIELWAPGELDAMLAHGVAALVPVSKYKRWFAELPAAFRDSVNKEWGPPEQARLMTVMGKGGEKCFVIPGIRVGNIYLGPQPLRATFERVESTSHDTLTPVPHSYVAAYLWY
jgi:cobaltochelatase CobN